jgi:hypothetical protein
MAYVLYGEPAYTSPEASACAGKLRKNPLRVKRVISTMRRPLPICPDKQTFSASVGMSQSADIVAKVFLG